MIAKLAGIVDQIGADAVVLDVNGVGYLVFCSANTLSRLPPPGSPARLLIETHLREDHLRLYGFADAAEQEWFRRLTTVQGVGARLALAILSVVTPDRLTAALLMQDKAALARAEGVGPKLAARIINELREKISRLAEPETSPAAIAAVITSETGSAADAISALVNLGYRRTEAFGAVAAAAQRLGGEAETAALIRAGLQELGR